MVPKPSAKLDQALTSLNNSAPDKAVRVLIHTRPGMAHLVLQRPEARRIHSRIDVSRSLVADLSRSALSTIADDRDVLRVSSDAPVLGMAAKKTVATLTTTSSTTTA